MINYIRKGENMTDELYLKLIDIADKEKVLDYIREMVVAGSTINGVWYEEEDTYEEMLTQLKKHEEIKYRSYKQKKPNNYQYLILRKRDDRLVGMTSIRPFLTKRLDESYGGNIGYSVRPTERRKGYATEGLKLAIDVCKQYSDGQQVMVCCNKDNIGSVKSILYNGGVLIAEKKAIISEQKYIIK